MDTAAEMERANHPGSFCLQARSDPSKSEFVYLCPCGCGVTGRLLVARDTKPSGPRPSWLLSGPEGTPTLEPSVNHVGHWHGWLRNGYWESV